jgi:sulfatase maturation enzyme AslB (radical SAM superfamily)
MINRDTYCPLPFSGFDTRVKSMCCWNTSQQFETREEMLAAPAVKQLQQDLVNGVKNDSCSACWRQESIGHESMRVQFFKKYPDADLEYPEEDIEYEIANRPLKYLVIDSGNVCNLACRTCGPSSSTGFYKEIEVRPKHIRRYVKLDIKVTPVDYLLSENLSHVRSISILGGEPFLNLNHLAVLQAIINQGNAGNCVLEYSTNGTVRPPQKLLEYFKHFRRVNISLSIDAVGDQFSYVRTMGRWADVLDNLTMFNEQPQVTLSVHPTVSPLNVLYLDELVAWINSENLRYSTVLCEYPEFYSFGVFTDQQREYIINQLTQSKYDYDNIIAHIQQAQYNPESKKQFGYELEWTKEYHGLDIDVYLPKLANLLRG